MAGPTFDPFPKALYSAEELLDGYDVNRPITYADMRDIRIYREFVASGGSASGDYLAAMARALHDNGITQHLADYVASKNVVAIMGGHSASRSHQAYSETAMLAAELSAKGFTVATGGGPGVMEAAHIGAAFAGDKEGLNEALSEMRSDPSVASIPKGATGLVGSDGEIRPAIAEALGKYCAPAVKLYRRLGRSGGLGIPTWLYGHEPFTPFASMIAKYFQNSIREEGLLALATSGIVYMQGSAGTMQEVFQDAAQNYYKSYPKNAGRFSPMAFFGDFWTKDIPIKPVLDALFGQPTVPPDPPGPGNDYREKVIFTSDRSAVVQLFKLQADTPSTFTSLNIATRQRHWS